MPAAERISGFTKDDVGHRQESGQAGEDFGANRGAVGLEWKAFEHQPLPEKSAGFYKN